jgi:hypothetical protein
LGDFIEDPVTALSSAISGAWTAASVDSTTPTIGPVYNYKRVDTRFGDFVLLYSVNHTERPASIGYSEIDYEEVVSVDIRTSASRARLIKLRDEVRRCVYSLKTTLGGYRLASITHVQDLSDRSIMLWRMVVDVRLRKVLDTTPS